MGAKSGMDIHEISRCLRRVSAGSRIKLELADRRFQAGVAGAIGQLVEACESSEADLLLEGNRLADLKLASTQGHFTGNRTFFFKVLRGRGVDVFGRLSGADLIHRVWKT